jgi:hypothetical protein
VVERLRQDHSLELNNWLISWCLKVICKAVPTGPRGPCFQGHLCHDGVVTCTRRCGPGPTWHPHAETTSLGEHVKRKIESKIGQDRYQMVSGINLSSPSLDWTCIWVSWNLAEMGLTHCLLFNMASNSERTWSATPREHHKSWYTSWQEPSRSLLSSFYKFPVSSWAMHKWLADFHSILPWMGVVVGPQSHRLEHKNIYTTMNK